MNVCMVTHSFFESDTRILQYTGALIDRGDEVDVIALRAAGMPAYEVLRGVRVFRIMRRLANERKPLDYLLQIMQFMVKAFALLSRKQLSRRYDVVHVHSVPDFLVFAALLPKLRGAKIILDIHDILPEFYAGKFQLSPHSLLFKILLLCERVSTAFADHVIVANEIWRDRLISRSVASEKCTAIRNYPDPQIFYPRRRRTDNSKFLILYPGTLNRHQGLDIAIRAFARVAPQMPEAEFLIHGQGSEKPALLKLREELGLKDRIHIEAFIPTDEIADVMADADLAVVPKRVSIGFGNEAASTKIMEFMALGVPVVVSRTRIDTYYHDDSMVKFVEPENETELAEAILDLWRKPELRQQLVEAGLRYVREHNWDDRKFVYFHLLEWPMVRVGHKLKGALDA